LGSVRLIELEQHVLDAPRLGWHREDDIVSARIPQFYFDYLRGGPGQPLICVVKHNQMDLRGLAALFGKINSLLDTREDFDDGADSLDLFGLSKFLHRKGEKERAHSACARALDAGLPAEFRPQATRDLALMAKRWGERERAAGLWQELVMHPRDGALACEQLAIHYERYERNFIRAMEFTELGLKKIRSRIVHSRDPLSSARTSRIEQRLLCRLARLRHRTGREQAAASTLLLAGCGAARKRTN
jgi:uncharacterized protein